MRPGSNANEHRVALKFVSSSKLNEVSRTVTEDVMTLRGCCHLSEEEETNETPDVDRRCQTTIKCTEGEALGTFVMV